MSNEPKNTAMPTILAFHYQILLALHKCFAISSSQAVWIEKDGDISIISKNKEDSEQIEVKDYENPLTDNHENFWKTLKNWLAPEFDHKQYAHLILHTTQIFGQNTKFSSWNNQDVETKLDILKSIYNENIEKDNKRKETNILLKAQGKKELPETNIYQIQREIFENNEDNKIKEVIEKIIINDESDDLDTLRKKFSEYLKGSIPEYNQKFYIEALIGFIYDLATEDKWCIQEREFIAEREKLTGYYCRKTITIPQFQGIRASEDDIKNYEEKLFVKKIKDIQYEKVLPEAVGNWIELRNTLNEEFDENPLYKNETLNYQKKLINRFKNFYNDAQLEEGEYIKKSKHLYNSFIKDPPISIDNTIPPIEYKNGLIHDAMDNEANNIKWRVDDE